MLEQMLKQVELSLINKRNSIRFEHNQAIETMLKNSTSKSGIEVLSLLLDISREQSNVIYTQVVGNCSSLSKAMAKANILTDKI